jgi:predicted nucleic acid-binding protein
VSPVAIIDAGPLTALLNPNDRWHDWALAALPRLPVPLLTSEAVLTETAYLLASRRGDPDRLFDLAEQGTLAIGIQFEQERTALRSLLRSYRDVPMSLADATLVRLSEMHDDCLVFTLDSDFLIYRRYRNKAIPVLIPEA